MSYKDAVISSLKRPLLAINSSAETELGRKLTEEEVQHLTNKFSLDVVKAAVEKVCFC